MGGIGGPEAAAPCAPNADAAGAVLAAFTARLATGKAAGGENPKELLELVAPAGAQKSVKQ